MKMASLLPRFKTKKLLQELSNGGRVIIISNLLQYIFFFENQIFYILISANFQLCNFFVIIAHRGGEISSV
jgi:hypothetical protein